METRITNVATDELVMIVTGTFYLIEHDVPAGMLPGASVAPLDSAGAEDVMAVN